MTDFLTKGSPSSIIKTYSFQIEEATLLDSDKTAQWNFEKI